MLLLEAVVAAVTLIVTTHTIPREDPGLIVSAVQRVLGALR